MKKAKNVLKHVRAKVAEGVYAYRGFEIWRDAMADGWTINGTRGGTFPTLKAAQAHVDKTIKYARKV